MTSSVFPFNFEEVLASASPEVPMNESLQSADFAAVYSVRQEVTSGLTLGYRGGRWGGFARSAGTLTLTNTATNYVVVQRSNGDPSVSTTSANWDNVLSYARVYKITMAGGVMTAVEDHRAGPNGIFGAITGAAAELRGLTFTSDTDSTADSDPGAGLFKWNNATQSSATEIYFDDTTADGKSLTTLWGSMGETGFITLQQGDDSTKWQEWRWTALPVDGTGYRKFTVSSQAFGGSIADNKLVLVDFESNAKGGVIGPSSATDNALARFDATTGKLIQNSTVTLDDSGNLAGAGLISAAGVVAGHTALLTTFTGGVHTPQIQVVAAGEAIMSTARFSANASSPRILLGKSRGATIGAMDVVTLNDGIGTFSFQGSDGTNFIAATQFTGAVDGTVSTGIVPGRSVVSTANSAGTLTEAMRWDSSQRVLGGITSALTIGQSNKLQIGGTAAVIGGIGVSRFSADASGTRIEFSKSRNATMGSNTIVQSGDALGQITWFGADGSDYDAAAQIIAEVDGAPGAGTDMPGRMRFLTSANGTATLTERLRIDNAGNVIVNTAAIATNATDGFLYVPSCAGTPTGTPTAYAGRVPIVVDTTNHKLYFNDGSWRDAGP